MHRLLIILILIACPLVALAQNADDLFNQALELDKQARYEEAISVYRQIIKLFPKLPNAYVNLGGALTELGRYEEATQYLRQAIQLNNKDDFAHNNLARALYSLKHYDEAVLECQETIRLNPQLTSSHYVLGLTYWHLGRRADAVKEWDETLRSDPGHKGALKQLSLARLVGNGSAKDHYIAALSLDKIGKYEEAYGEYLAANALDPTLDLSAKVGADLLLLKRYDEAVISLRAATIKAPNNPSPRYNLALALKQLKKYNDAIEEFKKVLRLNPQFADAHYGLGHAYWALGQWAESAREWEETLKLNPNDASAAKWLAQARDKLNP